MLNSNYLYCSDILEIITPDVFCYGIDVCYVDPGEKYCNLFPLPKNYEFEKAVGKFKVKYPCVKCLKMFDFLI